MTKVARIQAKYGANARVPGPRIQLARPARGTERQSNPQYYAFLSYSHKDEELADWLHRELEAFYVPPSLSGKLTANGVIPRKLAPIFRDTHELAAATDLGAEIRTALAASQFLIVLCSPAAAASRWTNAEVDAFKRSRPDGCVLAVLAAGEPFASDDHGREAEECFPPALRERYDKRGRPTGTRAEPIAADLRGGADERRTGFLKLVAGMLGVGLDELVRRETTRKQRRMAWVTGASLAGMIFAGGLAVTAIQARDAARDQRREAEGLVAFMLGDLKDKLEPIGKLDALDGVGTKVLQYYGQQDMSELSDAALLQRSRALSLTAQVAFMRGNLVSARGLYEEALAGTAEAIDRSPDDPQRLFDHAQNVFWIGEIARARGQTKQAETAYREYKRLAARMVQIEPDNLKWRMETQYAAIDVGMVLMSQRRFSEAGRNFQGALGPMESLAALDSNKMEYQKELSNLLAWLADAKSAEGQIDAAIAIRERQLAFLERLLERGARDVELGQQKIPAYTGLALLQTSRGEREKALGNLQLAAAEADRLIPVEPDNAIWKSFAAQARLEFGRALLSLGRREEAGREIQNGCEIASALRGHGPGLAHSSRLETDCLELRARWALTSGNAATALLLADNAVKSARRERSGDLIADRFRIAAAYLLLGDVQSRAGNSKAAEQAWNAGYGQLERNLVERPRELAVHMQLLQRLGRAVEARPLESRLFSIGFRPLQ